MLEEKILRLRNLMGLNEAFNYHFMGGKTGDQELDPTQKHVSDSISRMSGRDTGHFGSGTYFSTYKRDQPEVDQQYGEYSNFNHGTDELIKIDDGLYRMNIDIYKNLYKVTSESHAEGLFKTLKLCNEVFYGYESSIKYHEKVEWSSISTFYLKLRLNLKNLGLKLPDYRRFIEMMKDGVKDNDYNNKDENKSRASFSTRIMEFNGYNGVNVSGIPAYDNTTHGSVVYDLSKVGNDIEKVNEPFRPDWSHKYNHKSDIYGDSYFDIHSNMLGDKQILLPDDISKFNNLPENLQVSYMKRYNYYLWDETLNSLSQAAQKTYKKTLGQKVKSGVLKNEPNETAIKILIDTNQWDVINDKLLPIILWKFRFMDDTYKNKLIPHMRDLDDDEQDDLKYFKSST